MPLDQVGNLDRLDFGDRYILTDDGEERAALISLEELEAIETLENVLDLKEALRRIVAKGKDISPEEVYRELAP
jgi:PHD/YefM family antitoxin component YafN of YafNO toxin-antitoxin module